MENSTVNVLDGERHINNPEEIANNFNHFFGSIAEKTKTKIISTNKQFHEYLKNPSPDSIFLTPAQPQEILKLINNCYIMSVYLYYISLSICIF